ncbi:MAG: Ldh family oxidoreductase, partial [Promethearchaeota archaeon]
DMITGKAALLPLGGAHEEFAGHKGYGYATVVEILSSALQAGQFMKMLSGIAEDGSKTHFKLGHFFIAIDIDHFMGLDTFKKIAGSICRQLRSSQKAPKETRIYTAGEKEYEAERIIREQGVPISDSIQRDLILMRNELGLTQYKFSFE